MNPNRGVRTQLQILAVTLLAAFASAASANEQSEKSASSVEKTPTKEQPVASVASSKPVFRFDADLNGDGIIDSIQSLATFKRAQEDVVYASTVSNLLPNSTVDVQRAQPGSENARIAEEKSRVASEHAKPGSDKTHATSENTHVGPDDAHVASEKAQSRNAPKDRVSCLDYTLMPLEEKDKIDQKTQSRKGGVYGPPPCDPYVSDNVVHPFDSEHVGISILPVEGLNGIANHTMDLHVNQKRLVDTQQSQNNR